MKRWIAWAPLGVLVLLGVLFVGFALRHDPHYTPDALVGKPLPNVALPALDGAPPTALRGMVQGPTFVNVFASWCVPCVEEAPVLAQMKESGARIIGIATRDDPVDTAVFLQKHGNPYAAILVDRDGRASVELGASGYPETYLVDPAGVIVAKYAKGPLTMAEANRMLETLKPSIR